MSNIAILGHPTRGGEVIQLLEMLGGKSNSNMNGYNDDLYYYIAKDGLIYGSGIEYEELACKYLLFTLEEFEGKYPYKVGDKVLFGDLDKDVWTIESMSWNQSMPYDDWEVEYIISDSHKSRLCGIKAKHLKPYKEETNMKEIKSIDLNKLEQQLDEALAKETPESLNKWLDEENMEKRLEPVYELGTGKILYYVDNNSTIQDKGNISDGYHTFNELYEYRLLYNASMFNELAKQSLYDVHKSKLHSDGTIPFGDENWFIVQAELPTGQISNHYEIKDWDLFQVPIKEKANPYDGHTPQDVAKRLREFLTPKSQYPKNYEECCKVLAYEGGATVIGYDAVLLSNFQKLKLCRDAYWKMAGKEMGLDKPWKPDFTNIDNCNLAIKTCKGEISLISTLYIEDCILVFPTKEMRDAFYENFKDLINETKELL